MMGYGRGFYGYGDMMGGGSVLFMMFFGAVFVAGIVLLVLWALRTSHGHGTGGAAVPPASNAIAHDESVQIARRRLASGEITKEQYAEIMSALGS